MEPEETQEGQRPARRATPRILLYLGVIGVVVIVVLAGWVVLVNKPGPEGITAIEGREIADQIALNWSENATLIRVSQGEESQEGRCFSWFYTYSDSPVINNNTLEIGITVNTNSQTTVTEEGNISQFELLNGVSIISKWVFDSNEAYEIAIDNSEIASFMNHNPKTDGFFLVNETGNPTWFIDWTYDAGFDNPKWANIQIDANTGEVLYVEADT